VARVIVPDYQLSLAIGKEGQNARLAARLTGWRIDIRPDRGPGADEGGPQAPAVAGRADAPAPGVTAADAAPAAPAGAADAPAL
jgi:N utilization substance protein A